MLYKTFSLCILTLAFATSSYAKKDNYEACVKKARKQYDACKKDNIKRHKKGESEINCEAIQDLANNVCLEQHPIRHTTYDEKRLSQATSSDTASSSTPSPDLSPRSNDIVWTAADDDLLRTYQMSRDGFIGNMTTRKECKAKIHHMVLNIKNTPNANDFPMELVQALNKLCTITFQQNYSSNPPADGHSFETPSVLGNMREGASPAITPDYGSIPGNPLRNPALD